MSDGPHATKGKLVYLMGASGSGKDTLLQTIARIPGLENSVLVVQRYITRESREHCEGHIAVSEHDFVLRERAGEFVFSWQAHGHHYGVGREVLDVLAEGRHVLMNGSRRYLQTARDIYPDLVPVSLEVEQEVLRKRLIARGREDAMQIRARLQRACDYAHSVPEDTMRIYNNDRIEVAARRLLDVMGLQVLDDTINTTDSG